MDEHDHSPGHTGHGQDMGWQSHGQVIDEPWSPTTPCITYYDFIKAIKLSACKAFGLLKELAIRLSKKKNKTANLEAMNKSCSAGLGSAHVYDEQYYGDCSPPQDLGKGNPP